MKTRRTTATLAALLLAGGLAACGGSDDDDAFAAAGCEQVDEVAVTIFPGNIITFGVYVADQRGFLLENCLRLVSVNIASTNAGLAQAAQGGVDIVVGAPDTLMAARENGLDVKIVGSMINRVANSLVASADLELPHQAEGFPAVMQDLVGKSIGVTALNAGTHATARAMFEAAGLDPDSANYVAVGAGATQIAALSNGSVDAAIMPGNGQDVAVEQGIGVMLADLRTDGPWGESLESLTGSCTVYAAMNDLLEREPDLVERFVEANHDALEWARDEANREELYTVIQNSAPLSADVENAEQILRTSTDIYAGMADSTISRSSLDAWNEFALGLDAITAPVPFEELVWSGSEPYWTD